MAESKTPEPGKPLTEKQFTKVKDADGNELPNPVPKHWIGTDLVESGTKAVSGSSSSSSSSSSDVNLPEGAPSKSASKSDWVAYATSEDRGDDRLTEEQANELTRDQLVERYAVSS